MHWGIGFGRSILQVVGYPESFGVLQSVVRWTNVFAYKASSCVHDNGKMTATARFLLRRFDASLRRVDCWALHRCWTGISERNAIVTSSTTKCYSMVRAYLCRVGDVQTTITSVDYKPIIKVVQLAQLLRITLAATGKGLGNVGRSRRQCSLT